MSKLIIVLSGKKQSGKSSAAKFLVKEFLNRKSRKGRFQLIVEDDEIILWDKYNKNEIEIDTPNELWHRLSDLYKVGVYSFADPLKDFCINVLGLDKQQCYGTDRAKNSKTHILWESMPESIRQKYKKPRRGTGDVLEAKGVMTGREVMQIFGSDICRQIDFNCWSRGTYNKIIKSDKELCIVTDARFPNEVTMGTEVGAKVVRLDRHIYQEDVHDSEIALDDFPIAEYSLWIKNHNMDIEDTHKVLLEAFDEWSEQKGLS